MFLLCSFYVPCEKFEKLSDEQERLRPNTRKSEGVHGHGADRHRMEIEKRQTACKPGSVHARGERWMAIRLGRPLPDASRDLPGRRRGNPPAGGPKAPAGRPYSVLLPVGFTVPPPSPGTRCALTAPFHPCRPRRSGTGGLLSVALSLGLPPPGVTRHRASMEPGLSSPRRVSPSRKAAIRPSGARYI